MSNLIRSVAIQHLRHLFKLFLHRFYDKLYILQPEIYVVSNFTKDAGTSASNLEKYKHA